MCGALPRDPNLQRCIITKDGDDENYADDNDDDDDNDNDDDDENDDADGTRKKLVLQTPISDVKPHLSLSQFHLCHNHHLYCCEHPHHHHCIVPILIIIFITVPGAHIVL